MVQKKVFSAKNREATALRRRKYELVRRFGWPEDAMGGHLMLTYRRCGKPTCHCASERGHPAWTLSYSFEGRKHVEVLPEELATELRPLVEHGRQLREGLSELLGINLQLLRLWRTEQRDKPARRTSRNRKNPAPRRDR